MEDSTNLRVQQYNSKFSEELGNEGKNTSHSLSTYAHIYFWTKAVNGMTRVDHKVTKNEEQNMI